MYFCYGKAVFSAAVTPVFSVTWSFRNHSDLVPKIIYFINNVENSTAA